MIDAEVVNASLINYQSVNVPSFHLGFSVVCVGFDAMSLQAHTSGGLRRRPRTTQPRRSLSWTVPQSAPSNGGQEDVSTLTPSLTLQDSTKNSLAIVSRINTRSLVRSTFYVEVFFLRLRKPPCPSEQTHFNLLTLSLSSWKDLQPCNSSSPALYTGKLPRPACFYRTHPWLGYTRSPAR